MGKGSGRSIAGVDLGAAILAAKDNGLLFAGGGHAMAAGLTVAGSQVDALADFLDERLAGDVARARGERALLLDAILTPGGVNPARSEEPTSELQSLMRISYAVFCFKKTNK